MMPGIAGGDNCDDDYSDNYDDAERRAPRERLSRRPAGLASLPGGDSSRC
jgi:hypothetical protein